MDFFEIVPAECIAQIKQLGYQTYRPHYLHLWYDESGIEWYLDRCFGERQLAADLADPMISYYAVLSGGQEAGLLKLVRHKAPFDGNPQTALYLEKIYFLKEFTGQGLGQKTMQWVEEQARRWGLERVWLMVMDSSHKPMAGYEKAGFQPIGRTRLNDEEFRRLRSELRGMIVMEKRL